MAKIEITLVDKQRKEVAKLKVDSGKIYEAACLVYQNRTTSILVAKVDFTPASFLWR